ncbi:hypothetical protein ABK905_06380 [Acerihabitans sp. KWT182]|uniref:E3 ubiquitin ligase SopA-like central domain-containing protein n=1 Tax=Acerihabitans sp. KWT182 TaxID=3157919 RepID=A0AAU7QCH2_9GAMM
MARELMHSLQKASVSRVAPQLINAWSKAPYNDDAAIAAWLDTLCESYLKEYDGARLPLLSDDRLKQAAVLFACRSERMFSHNGAFIQMVAQGMKRGTTTSRQA